MTNKAPQTKQLQTRQLSPRAKVIALLVQIQTGKSLATLMPTLLATGAVPDKDKAFVHELLLGTLRQWWALCRIIDSLADSEIYDDTAKAGLAVGLYQLLFMGVPDYAAIFDTVEALKQLGKERFASLCNAILRKVAKNPQKFAKKASKNHSLPNWLAKRLKQDWGEYYADMGQTLRQSAPIFLRVNTSFTTVDDYVNLLAQQGIAFEKVATGFVGNATDNSVFSSALRLMDNVKITDLPHFADGWVSVQDLHAQLSAQILTSLTLKKATVLDACTAPGGKLAHLLELFHVEQCTQLIALDNDQTRLNRVKDNLERLQLQDGRVKLVCDDATTFCSDKPFDLIVLDAPCTATGVIRRHPDINLLRTDDDVAQTTALQNAILTNCWQNLADNGYLLYITCSLLKAENERQIQAFLACEPNAVAVEFILTLPNQIKQDVGYQCLPLDINDGDGFYYALLQKSIKAK